MRINSERSFSSKYFGKGGIKILLQDNNKNQGGATLLPCGPHLNKIRIRVGIHKTYYANS